MPQKSGFFDTTADDPREYPAREFAEYFARFVGNGVFGGGEKLKVTATGKDMNVSINLGYGWINGYMYSVFDTPLVLPIQQATTQDRIDRIILRLDVSTPVRAIRAIVLQGNPGTTPQVPTIVRSGDVYDLSLAQVLVKANTSTIQGHQVTDERLNTQVCGIVTALISQADTTSIFNEFQSWLRTKTAEYQKQWDDFMKDIQDKGFATTQYVDQQISEKAASKKHYHDASDITSGTMSVDRLPSASTSNAGITQLSTATNGTRSNVAATESAVKAAMDKANEAFQSASEGKNQVAAAITGKGVPASGSDTYPVLAQKIGQIYTGVPFARIKTNVSKSRQNFYVSEGSSVTWGLFYVMVTGLSFQAKGIIVLDGMSKPLSVFDFSTNQKMWVSGATNYHQVDYRDTLPQLGGSIFPTITPNSFIIPATYYDDYSDTPVTVIAYG
ncbi:phage tail protein [Paenibacillus alvei]|uniref:Phage tail protein n=1 Tax=Paenibacillus alvei TaxID=44250 RepID=A0ABT4H576_PAEAL|nr:phage tail protein [Paenibacillus alvei]MCY9764137.1 phage tail protein [Paenibacillus alvei]MCY9770519.1 phage tail protein [Paenibacillus alvei]